MLLAFIANNKKSRVVILPNLLKDQTQSHKTSFLLSYVIAISYQQQTLFSSTLDTFHVKSVLLHILSDMN